MANVKSFRISDETMDKFKGISTEIGGNQEQALEKLIECYELQQLKGNVATNNDDIEEFENFLSIIARKYIGLMESKINLRDSLRMEYVAELEHKNDEIDSLKKELQNLQTVKSENESLKLEIESLKEKIKLFSMANVEDMDSLRSKNSELEKANIKLEKDVIKLEKEIIKLQKNMK